MTATVDHIKLDPFSLDTARLNAHHDATFVPDEYKFVNNAVKCVFVASNKVRLIPARMSAPGAKMIHVATVGNWLLNQATLSKAQRDNYPTVVDVFDDPIIVDVEVEDCRYTRGAA